ncbi:MAG: hypothetical protein GF383_02520 [Candidatus Lokiarchaeota archaeon]|nr:hypothetical protein [Candidatus Lokiarchaeota archaeon]MBD3338296.1 hypothetical protein [Candidatus Lokiarchaeota archaeon]
MEKQEKINSIDYILNVINNRDLKDICVNQTLKLTTSIKIGFRVILYSKKWLIYLALAFLDLLIFYFEDGININFKHPDEEFIDIFFDILFPHIFVFGCLLISLPISADEISDHTLDMYLVRPIKREVYWVSRWIVVNISVYLVNVVIYFVHFLFFFAYAKNGPFTGLLSNIEIFGWIMILLIPATLIYSGLFLLVGMIGNRGLILGLLLALFDLIFVGLFFLDKNPYIPKPNLHEIANEILSDHVNFRTPQEVTFTSAIWYSFFFALIVFVTGGFFLRIREIK